jgi:hypothetical protein
LVRRSREPNSNNRLVPLRIVLARKICALMDSARTKARYAVFQPRRRRRSDCR